MFSKKTHGDIKKSALKINDLKKDTVTRYKHLKHVLGMSQHINFKFFPRCLVTLIIFPEHISGTEAKSFFETNYSNIYHIFYDNFIIAEANLKQKGEKKKLLSSSPLGRNVDTNILG